MPSLADRVSCGVPTISRNVAKSRTRTRTDRSMATTTDKALPSRRLGLGQDLSVPPTNLRGEPLDVGIEELLELGACRLGTGRSQIAEHLDPTASAVLVVPEVEVRTAADLLRRHATAELHR